MQLVAAAAIVLLCNAAFGQSRSISPTAEFDLNAGVKAHHFGKYSQSFLAVTPSGMTVVTIGENNVSLTTADLDGRVLHSRTDLASVHAQIYAALPRPDGCVWLLSSGPFGLFQNTLVLSEPGSAFSAGRMTGLRAPEPGPNFTQMDLYSPLGDHLDAARMFSFVAGAETPIAAGNSQVVLRTEMVRGGSVSQQTLLHFGNIVDGNFREQTQVKLVPPAFWGIALIGPNGDLLLMDRASGNRMAISPTSRSGKLVRLINPLPVKAAAADADYVYLLSRDSVLKTDSAGQVLAIYRLQFGRGFVPVDFGVTGNTLVLVDRTGHGERFEIGEGF